MNLVQAGNMKVRGDLGYSIHEIEDFRILHGSENAVSRTTIWISGESTFTSSRTRALKVRGTKRAGYHSDNTYPFVMEWPHCASEEVQLRAETPSLVSASLKPAVDDSD